MKPALILVAVAAILSVAPASPPDGVKPTPKEQIEASERKIKELKAERLDVLKRMTGLFEYLCKVSRRHVDDLLEARQLLTEAELEAAKTDAERIAILKNLVATLKGYESVAGSVVKAGQATEEVALRAKAKRLEAEIRLERATHPPERAAPAPKGRAGEPSQAVKELRKERIVVLKKQVDVLVELLRHARIPPDKVAEAIRLLVAAELEAAGTDAERVERSKYLVTLWQQCEASAKSRFAAGRTTQPFVLRATAKRLEAEIRLEQAKIAAAKAGQ
jgi:hypothetical protein